MGFIVDHPFECILVGLTLGLAMYVGAEILPKVLRNREKKDLEALSQTSSHDIAAEPGVELYYDTSFPIVAYETTKDFVSLETGWKYGAEETYDFKTAAPEVEEPEEREDATDFEKQGLNRQMLR